MGLGLSAYSLLEMFSRRAIQTTSSLISEYIFEMAYDRGKEFIQNQQQQDVMLMAATAFPFPGTTGVRSEFTIAYTKV